MIPKLLSRMPIFPLFIAVSFFLGWIIPGFYEWTGSDQSRPSPLIWQFALGLTVGGVLICLSLPFLPMPREQECAEKNTILRFNLRTLLALMAGIAFLIVGLMRWPMVVSSLLYGAAFIYFLWFCVRSPHHRMPAAGLAASMCLPFVWLIGYNELENIWQAILWMAAGLPMLLPAALLSGWFDQNLHEATWLTIILTAVELFVGTQMIRCGPKRTIAYLVFVLLVSVFSSFGLHALVLA